MINILKNDINKFVGAIHVADVHIRLLKRHDEYVKLFENFYNVIDKTPAETVVCICGDLLHSKSDLSPECIDLASDFLKNLSDRRPTILISGNHDAILSNKSRLDSLSPIVKSLNHPNLYYLKNSGLYILGDILFNNMSVFDSPDKYIRAEQIPSIYRNKVNHIIGLYHGPINNAMTDLGYRVSDKTMTIDTFDGHDMVFLGDIHQHQILQEYDDINKKPVIVYPSSMCQQDHGEDLECHGYVIWNLPRRKFLQMNLPNEYGFFTIDIDKGNLITDITNIPKKVRLRVRCKESVATEVKNVLSEIKKHSQVLESVYFRVESDGSGVNDKDLTELNLNEIYSTEYQNKLIKEYIVSKSTDKQIDQSVFDKIFEINKDLNANLNKDLSSRNIKWIPKKFEFSNMFSYGENNVIDFTKINGITGLFANNASGKSSIFSALTFCLFDKCERTFKASYILNAQKMSFKCKFNFEINGVDFFIERVGTSDKKGNVKVNVKFWKEENGVEKELHGEARRSTNDIIRDYIGTYEDFILTTLSVQTSNNKSSSAFVDMGQTERKDLLSQFMGLTLFDNLYQSATDKLKEINFSLKEYNKDSTDSKSVLEDYKNKIIYSENNLRVENEKLDSENQKKIEINQKIIDENKKLIKLSSDVPTNIEQLESTEVKLKNKIASLTDNLPKLMEENTKNKAELTDIQSKLDNFIACDIEARFKKYKDIIEKRKENQIAIDKKKIIVTNKLEKLKKLEEHEYDPNCQFCVNNIFVKDAIETKKSLDVDKTEVMKLVELNNLFNAQIEDIKETESEYNTFLSAKQDKIRIEKQIANKDNEILRMENAININKTELTQICQKIQLYYQQKDAIDNNLKVEREIDILSGMMKSSDAAIKLINNNIIKLNLDLAGLKKSEQSFKDNLAKMKEYEELNNAYELYTMAVSRDGIPFELISKAVPIIEKEVNSILHQIVDFTIKIETDGKNVMTYIVYDNKSWPLEMSSGMEKFISSIAIRVSLINISNLPKTNCMIVDEGWGTLDSNSISSVRLLLDYLKTMFDFIIIVSHIDAMKDIVSNRLEIIKTDDGFSKIEYNG